MNFSLVLCTLGLLVGIASASYIHFYRTTRFNDDAEWRESIYARSVRLIRHLWSLRDQVDMEKDVFSLDGLKMVRIEKIDDLLKTMDGWWILRGEAAVKDTLPMAQSFAETGLKRICDEVKSYVPLDTKDCGKYLKVRCCFPDPFQKLDDNGLLSYIRSKKNSAGEKIAKSLEEEKPEGNLKSTGVFSSWNRLYSETN